MIVPLYPIDTVKYADFTTNKKTRKAESHSAHTTATKNSSVDAEHTRNIDGLIFVVLTCWPYCFLASALAAYCSSDVSVLLESNLFCYNGFV
jgi:hypothetical protein